MLILPELPQEPAPKGKRSIRETKWGNTNAHIAGRFWRTIGPTYAAGVAEEAEQFLKGEID